MDHPLGQKRWPLKRGDPYRKVAISGGLTVFNIASLSISLYLIACCLPSKFCLRRFLIFSTVEVSVSAS